MGLKLEDIGRMAGVSRSTVSRVVNGENNVRPEVRRRVEQVIRDTGYRPNAAARSLVSNRSGIVGLVIPSRVHNLFEDPYFARLIQGVTLAGNRAGLMVSLFLFSSEEEERELSHRIVDSGFLDGVIVSATRRDDPLVARLTDAATPLVMVGRPDVDTVSHVDVDNVDGGRLAARHLASTGARRIGMIGAPASTTAGVDRLRGFVDGLASVGAPFDPQDHVDGEFSDDGGYRAMRRLLDRGVDAVFAASDSMAFGALRAARERDVRVPDELQLIGFDGFSVSERTDPPLSTIRQPVAETAARAVELLAQLVSGDLAGPGSTVLPVELVVRGTTRTPDRRTAA